MDKQQYKNMVDQLKLIRNEVMDTYDDHTKLIVACDTLIEHCQYKSRPSLLALIKAVRTEMPWLGLKEAKDLMEEFIEKNC